MPANAQYSSFQNTLSGPSPSLWYKVPIDSLSYGMGGHVFFDDFLTYVAGSKYTATAATTGTAALLAGAEGGYLDLDSGSTTADQGINLQSLATIVTPVANRKIYFEARVALREQAAAANPELGAQIFVGLSEMDTTVFAAGANTSANHIGFEMNALTQAGTVGTAGTANLYGEKAGARNVAAANVGLNVHPFVANTFIKLGFLIDGLTSVKAYLNGVHTLDVIPTANIPIVPLALTMCCLTEVTVRPLLRADWWMCASVSDDAN